MSIANPKTPGGVTIRYVVMSVLNRLKDYSMRHYSFLEQIVFEGYSELGLFHLGSVEVVYLRMSEAKVVDLPCDYVDYLKIGIPIAGKIRVLSKKDSILLPRTFEDGAPVGNTDDPNVGGIAFSEHFRAGRMVDGLYGFPGGVDMAYYRIDRENRQIVFSGSVPRAEIVLEYVSSGVNLQGGTVIPREAVGALRAFALWQLIENDKKTPANEKERKMYQYEAEVEKLRAFTGRFTADEYRRMVWSKTRQSIKR